MKQLQKLVLISTAFTSLLIVNATAEETKPSFDKPKCETKKCHAKEMRSKHRMHHRNPMMGAIRYLDLSKEQRMALRDLRKAQRDEMRAMRKEMRKGKKGEIFVQALSKDGLNKEMMLKDATKKFEERMSKKIDHLQKVIAILTPEQRVELKKMLGNKMNNRKDMMKEAPAVK
jgi:Spy/CpxP family protein refolding chaperone